MALPLRRLTPPPAPIPPPPPELESSPLAVLFEKLTLVTKKFELLYFPRGMLFKERYESVPSVKREDFWLLVPLSGVFTHEGMAGRLLARFSPVIVTDFGLL